MTRDEEQRVRAQCIEYATRVAFSYFAPSAIAGPNNPSASEAAHAVLRIAGDFFDFVTNGERRS
jgi:hypothetical protein